MAEPEEYLTIAEAAAVAHVSKRTVERWVAGGVVRVVRVGRVVRIRRRDLERVLAPPPPPRRGPSRSK